LEMLFLGPPTVGSEILATEGISQKNVFAGKLRRWADWQNILDIFKLPLGLIQSLWHLFFFMPHVVFSKGGYGSVPTVFGAWLYRIPIIIHESDSIPGLANRINSHFSRRIAISFSSANQFFPTEKTALTGNPVRPTLLNGDPTKITSLFGLSNLKPLLLVLGGSQGAQAINNLIIESLPLLLPRCEIIHQCGQANFDAIKQSLENKIPLGYSLQPFLDEASLATALAAAKIVISRAGAGSIAEIAALGKPSILIPLPNSAADHQLYNASEYAKTGAALIIDQMNLTPHLFQSQVLSLLDKPETLIKMGHESRKFNPPDATLKIVQEILNLAKL
ncbi:MAG: UDP-N-acetylglucosamine--N-acetylmuramyl-(pentapeptide) pyrophosphoryl-undecaprenol N-acetylglucosamine transferase, partial [Patescibacteria group bacterium]